MQITRIKPGGWIIILFVLAGILFGVRSCGRFFAGRPVATGRGDVGNEGGGPAVDRDSNLAIIYPTPTANADLVVLLLSAPWASDSQKKIAQAFLDFLSRSEARDDGVHQYFRPAQGDVRLLAKRLGPNARAELQISPPTIDLQPYDALNEAASQWRTQMK